MTELQRTDLGHYLAKYSLEMQLLAKKVRELILEVVPEVDELIKWKNLYYQKNKPVCAILIHKNHINLEFTRGRELTELGYPLEGTGKNMRHVKIHTSADINQKLREIIEKGFELDKMT
jgi:hypothetical protein